MILYVIDSNDIKIFNFSSTGLYVGMEFHLVKYLFKFRLCTKKERIDTDSFFTHLSLG